jgi:hypothetical protein
MADTSLNSLPLELGDLLKKQVFAVLILLRLACGRFGENDGVNLLCCPNADVVVTNPRRPVPWIDRDKLCNRMVTLTRATQK